MPRYPKNRSNLEELLMKIDNVLRSLEKDKTEVKREGRVKDVGGIRGVDIDYYFSVKSLTDNESGTKDFEKKMSIRGHERTCVRNR